MILRILTAIAMMVLMPFAAHAQDWPSKPVRMIVPFAAGGSTDVAARLIAEYLTRAFGQQVFVENRTGANGVIGIEAAAKSDPDGYTVLITADAIASNPHVYKVNYDALKDLTPVIQLSRQAIVLAVHPSLGVKTVPELIALAKRQPGIRYGTGSGVGSSQHMVVQWFAQLAGIELEQVPYRGGGQAINDLIAGHVLLGALGSTPLIPHYKAGKLLLLAQTTEARSQSLPDIPTFQEAGIKGLVMDQWLGALVPAGTPAAIVTRLNAEIAKALADPAIKANLVNSAQEPIGGSAESFARLMREDFAKYQRLVRDLKIKAQQ
jgi:tripartite-type tricarboxylate transporter receptor subunit TctC